MTSNERVTRKTDLRNDSTNEQPKRLGADSKPFGPAGSGFTSRLGHGLLYMGDHSRESILYAYDEPPLAEPVERVANARPVRCAPADPQHSTWRLEML